MKVAKKSDTFVKVIGDKLYYKKKAYTLETVHTSDIDVESIAVKDDGKTVAFCSRFHPLSNMYPERIVVDGKSYASTEHYYQYEKCKQEGRDDIAALVKLAEDPESAMAVGGRVKMSEEWCKTNGKKIMKKAAKEKFRTPRLKKKLLNTGDKKIVEATRNKTWACGLSFNDKSILDSNYYTGENLMGEILCEIREELRAET